MNLALKQAIIALIRADAVIAPALGVSDGATASIFPAEKVPADAPFPRCYVAIPLPSRYRLYGTWARDRKVTVDVLFAHRDAEANRAGDDPSVLIETWDAHADTLIRGSLVCPDMIEIRRVSDVPIRTQYDQRETYYLGGGRYEAVFQDNF